MIIVFIFVSLFLYFNIIYMQRQTKIIYFLVIIILSVFFKGCKKDKMKSTIPYVYVNFSMRLDDPLFSALNAEGNSVMVTYDYAQEYSAGYDNNGIIVYRASIDEFYAFDATCPHDLDSISVAVDIDGSTVATCPVCSSRYILFNHGYPTDAGPSQKALQEYITEFDNDMTITVHSW